LVALAILLSACSKPEKHQFQDKTEVEIPRELEAPTAQFTPDTPVPTPSSTATPLPTLAPTATPVPEIKLFAPDYLQPNVLAAIQKLESSPNSWRWTLVESIDAADIHLEPGDLGVPAGHRAIALTVPFEMAWEDVTFEEAENIVAGGHDDVLNMDWALMPARRKALRINGLRPSDKTYPLKMAWSLVSSAGYEQPALELAPHISTTINRDRVLHLASVGDLMLARAIGYALENGDLSFPFGAVTAELEKADITVGNLESALGDRGQAEVKSYTFLAPPVAADALTGAGFDLLSLANNHAMDYGPEALEQALDLLEQNGIATVGAGQDDGAARRPVIMEYEGITVAFLGYVDVPVEVSGFDTHSWSATGGKPGVAWADPVHISEDVAAAKLESDIVVVLLHSGYEYVESPSPEQMRAAHKAVEAGADLVIGHHAHVLQGVEFQGESVIAYGLGNFAFEIDGDPATAVLNVWIDSDGVRQLEFLPAIIEAGGRPRFAAPWEAFEIRQRVYYLTSLLNLSP
jgi:poly-gamma-glutamate synthesis protein (capsule biosynthesis protein)